MYASTMRFLPCGSCVGLLRWALLFLPLLSSEVLGDCGHPSPPLYAVLKNGPLNESYPVGAVLRYHCIPGYENIPEVNSSIRCLDTSVWSETPTFCRPRKCRPPVIENGRIASTDDLMLGTEVTFSCDYGYRLIGQTKARCVVLHRAVGWDTESPYCQPILCFPPPRIANGRHSGDDRDEYPFGIAVTYRCDAGFSLIGTASISCSAAENGVDGAWSPAAPECKDVHCKKPEILNGRVASVFQSTYIYDNSVRIECDPGYMLQGSDFIKCRADSLWQPAVPTCVRSTTTTTTTTTTVHPGDKKDETTGPPRRPTSDSAEKPGTTQSPDGPDSKDKSGSGQRIAIAVGAAVAVIVVIAAVILVMNSKSRHKRGKNAPPPGPSESYRAVVDKDLPMEVK